MSTFRMHGSKNEHYNLTRLFRYSHSLQRGKTPNVFSAILCSSIRYSTCCSSWDGSRSAVTPPQADLLLCGEQRFFAVNDHFSEGDREGR